MDFLFYSTGLVHYYPIYLEAQTVHELRELTPVSL